MLEPVADPSSPSSGTGTSAPSWEFGVYVRPGGRRNALEGLFDGVLAVRVSAPATEGRANHAVCRVMADAFGVACYDVHVVAGRSSKRKRVRIDGDATALAARYGELVADAGP
jgi:hypothetical protein